MLKNSWARRSEDVYEQDLSFVERLFIAFKAPAGTYSTYGLVIMTDFDYGGRDDTDTDVVDLLKRSWTALRYHHPAAMQQYDEQSRKKVYKVLRDPDDIKTWHDRTFTIHYHETPEQVYEALRESDCLILHYFPPCSSQNKQHQLLFQGHHYMMDARGGWSLLDRFYNILANERMREDIQLGDEWTRLPPPLEDLLGITYPQTQHDMETAAASYQGFDDTDPMRMPLTQEELEKPAQQYARLYRKLSKETSAAIIDACHRTGNTIGTVWTTSQILAVTHIQWEKAGFTQGPAAHTMAMFDLRRQIHKDHERGAYEKKDVPYDPHVHDTSCYFTALPFSVPGGSSFRDIARYLGEFYGREPTPDKIRALPSIIQKLIKMLESYPKTSVPMYSNMGVAEQFLSHEYGDHGEVQVGDIWVGLTHTEPWLLVGCFSWKDQIRFSICSNRAWYPNNELERMTALGEEILLQGLGVKEETPGTLLSTPCI
ncbi:hypothetical protein F4778DRAFT_523037 [Xylariomycetidae sp. FL2044]|nr:hypothetical protein F4778DRAFT_523037 [Xylariomycetidae sp. FL2044]